MNEALLLDSIGKIIVFLLFLFAVFLLTVKSQKRRANYLFAAFLLVTAFDLSGLFLGAIYDQYPRLMYVKVASSLLQMPLFYGYVVATCYKDFTWHWRLLGHTLLFWIFLIAFNLQGFSSNVILAYEIVGEFQYVAYIIAIFWTLNKYKTVYLENFSNPDDTAYRWLFQATVLFCIGHTLVIIRWLLSYTEYSVSWSPWINVVVSISALLITCWLVMRSMYKPQLFLGVETKLQPLRTPQKQQPTTEQEGQLKVLQTFMQDQKPYLDYALSLEKLASLLDMEDKELSLLINHHLGKHFFDFVNAYRIADAKALLTDPSKQKTTVLEILYAVGFNSKSSFYTAFKKETGVTPVKYRQSFR